jgi:pyridoxine 5-phosphate synthase
MNAVRYTLDIGLTVNAGHGLNYVNVQKIASLQEVRGLYIGHSIISRAVLVGMEKAVREMKELIQEVAEKR